MTQNFTPTNIIRPDELITKLGIKKVAYYEDLSHLDIKQEKDCEGKAYLTIEQVNKIRALRNHVNETGSKKGFNNS